MFIKKLVFSAIVAAGLSTFTASGDRLVILHSNDTHSQIDPNDNDFGGILRRKVLIDSVRSVEPNVLLVDAGDAVQGSLYYSLFQGEVERKMMNNLGYDIQILGNHEFDSGLDILAREWKQLKARKLASNYDLTATPLDGITESYAIYEFEGRKIGFIAINIDPKGMVDDKKSVGVVYLDGVETANRLSRMLKEEKGVDMVVALTHIGYTGQPGYSDVDLVSASHDIDLVIGGHSHTCIIDGDPASVPAWIMNADGDSILVAQTGSRGVNLGEITVDLETMIPQSRVIPVTSRLDDMIDVEAGNILLPYREAIDSIHSVVIGYAGDEFSTDRLGLLNFVSDFVYEAASSLSPDRKIDLAIMNRGGIRCGILPGEITKGRIMTMLPFDNRIQIIDIKGSDLLRAFDVMAMRHGDGVSRNVFALMAPDESKCERVLIDNRLIIPDHIYRVATIDYLADGGDYMQPLTKAEKVATSDEVLYEMLINFFVDGPLKGKSLRADDKPRMVKNLAATRIKKLK